MLLIYIIVAIVALSYIWYLIKKKRDEDDNIWDYSMDFKGFIGALLFLIIMILSIIKILF